MIGNAIAPILDSAVARRLILHTDFRPRMTAWNLSDYRCLVELMHCRAAELDVRADTVEHRLLDEEKPNDGIE